MPNIQTMFNIKPLMLIQEKEGDSLMYYKIQVIKKKILLFASKVAGSLSAY